MRISKFQQQPSNDGAGLSAALIRVNPFVASRHSSRAPGEAICEVASIRGRYVLSVFLAVRGCVSSGAKCALVLFDLVAPPRHSYRRSPSGRAIAAAAKTTACGSCNPSCYAE